MSEPTLTDAIELQARMEGCCTPASPCAEHARDLESLARASVAAPARDVYLVVRVQGACPSDRDERVVAAYESQGAAQTHVDRAAAVLATLPRIHEIEDTETEESWEIYDRLVSKAALDARDLVGDELDDGEAEFSVVPVPLRPEAPEGRA